MHYEPKFGEKPTLETILEETKHLQPTELLFEEDLNDITLAALRVVMPNLPAEMSMQVAELLRRAKAARKQRYP